MIGMEKSLILLFAMHLSGLYSDYGKFCSVDVSYCGSVGSFFFISIMVMDVFFT